MVQTRIASAPSDIVSVSSHTCSSSRRSAKTRELLSGSGPESSMSSGPESSMSSGPKSSMSIAEYRFSTCCSSLVIPDVVSAEKGIANEEPAETSVAIHVDSEMCHSNEPSGVNDVDHRDLRSSNESLLCFK